jgi:predicted acyl esterase
VNLWISSSCPDTDFTAKLIDAYPPNPDYPEGFSMNLTDGILRVRYRDSWERPFKRGHRIRIDISSSNFPHFDAKADSTRVATNRVYMDVSRPSHVVLPVIPSRR